MTSRAGVTAGLLAYATWGFFPIYFKQLGALPPIDILCWRIVFAFVTLLVGMLVAQGLSTVWQRIRSVEQWSYVLAATVLISVNWFVFVYAISVDQILQGSLGYFLVPLVNSALGVLVFGERPNRLKQLAIAIAGIGMVLTFLVAQVVPVLALLLALSFGLYGMVRKRTSVDNATGLLLETALLAPLAAGFLWLYGLPIASLPTDAARYWLYASGILTLAPLLCMVYAARRIEFGTLGFLQYLTPMMQFMVAIGIYGEQIDLARGMAFMTTLLAIGVWIAGSHQEARSATT